MYNNNYNNNNYNKNYYNNNNTYGHKSYKNKSNYYNNQNRNNYTPNVSESNNQVIKSEEQGFTGNPSNWFSDDEFMKRLVANLDYKNEKDSYFGSYSHFYIHEEMIKDSVRTGSYRAAIENNKDAFKDKIVLDIGCGTGILSIFAARAGAKHVYSIEFADIADYAREIIKRNGLSDKITVIKSKVEEAVLPVEKVDIIISEWMGYFLLYEAMLDTVLYARDKWLAKDGIMLPDRCTISFAAIEDSSYKKSKLDFWNDVGYNINMSCIKQSVLQEPIVDIFNKNLINTSVCKVLDIDLYTCTKEDLDFSNQYELTFIRRDTLNGLAAWFDCYFNKLPNKVNFSTGPYSKNTHWKQVIFYTEKDIYVEKGEVLKGSIAVRKNQTNFRELDIKISFHLNGQSGKQDWYQLYKLR